MLTRRRLVARASSIVWFAAIAGLCAAQTPTGSPASGAALEQGFESPPDEAKPRVWWHWMNGNITKEGIKLDLEWMHRVGIGGFQNFDASLFPDQVVEKRLVYMTPEWKEAFQYATTLADQLGLEMAIAGSPGWSESGGPWVTPAQAMKKLVWSETRVAGGTPFTGRSPKPPTTNGPFQNAPLINLTSLLCRVRPSAAARVLPGQRRHRVRVPAGDVPMAALKPTVTSSGGTIDPVAARRRRLRQVQLVPEGARGREGVDPDSPSQSRVTIRGVSLAHWPGFKCPFGPPPPGPDLEASDDGQSFQEGRQHSREHGRTEHGVVPAGPVPASSGWLS